MARVNLQGVGDSLKKNLTTIMIAVILIVSLYTMIKGNVFQNTITRAVIKTQDTAIYAVRTAKNTRTELINYRNEQDTVNQEIRDKQEKLTKKVGHLEWTVGTATKGDINTLYKTQKELKLTIDSLRKAQLQPVQQQQLNQDDNEEGDEGEEELIEEEEGEEEG